MGIRISTAPYDVTWQAIRAIHQPHLPPHRHAVGQSLRYKSSLIHADSYLLTCMRYIELNPVRAAMVDDPAHYRWSSYRSNALGQTDSRLTPHPLYFNLGLTDKPRNAAYRALFRSELDAPALDDIRLAINQSQPLGNSRFLAKVEKVAGECREARPRGRPRIHDMDAEAPAGKGKFDI